MIEIPCNRCNVAYNAEKLKKKNNFCKPCVSELNREVRIKRLFNMTLAEYQIVFEHQKGLCAICLKPPKNTKLAIDHDHATGIVRGLLCPMCNRALASFRDNLDRFRNAVRYFEEHPVTVALGAPKQGLRGRVSNKAATVRRLNKDLLPADLKPRKKRRRKSKKS